MVNYSKSLSLEEETKILQYIIQNNNYKHLHDDLFWKKMEKSDITQRTWQTLKDHFEKKIICKLKDPHFKLPEDIIAKFNGIYLNKDVKSEMLQSYEAQTDKEENDKDKTILLCETSSETKALAAGKRLLVTRTYNTNKWQDLCNENLKTNSRRILVTRVNNPSPQTSYSKCSSDKPNKTVLGTLCPARRKEIFVAEGKTEEIFERYDKIPKDDDKEEKKPKRLICFSYDKINEDF